MGIGLDGNFFLVSFNLTHNPQKDPSHYDEPLLPLWRGRRALGVPCLWLPVSARGHAGAGGQRGLPGVRPGVGLFQPLWQLGSLCQTAGLRWLVVSILSPQRQLMTTTPAWLSTVHEPVTDFTWQIPVLDAATFGCCFDSLQNPSDQADGEAHSGCYLFLHWGSPGLPWPADGSDSSRCCTDELRPTTHPVRTDAFTTTTSNVLHVLLNTYIIGLCN